MTPDQHKALKQASAILGEWFPDYLVCTRIDGIQDLPYFTTDRTWMIGASHRLLTDRTIPFKAPPPLSGDEWKDPLGGDGEVI